MNETTVTFWLTCCECGERCNETWDDRCMSCWYVYSGGDQGRDEWAHRRAVIRNGTIFWWLA